MFYIHPTGVRRVRPVRIRLPGGCDQIRRRGGQRDAEFVAINREYFGDAVTGLGDPGGWDKRQPHKSTTRWWRTAQRTRR